MEKTTTESPELNNTTSYDTSTTNLNNYKITRSINQHPSTRSNCLNSVSHISTDIHENNNTSNSNSISFQANSKSRPNYNRNNNNNKQVITMEMNENLSESVSSNKNIGSSYLRSQSILRKD